jgi:hypothetical protein
MEMEAPKPQPTRRIFPSAVLIELLPRIVNHHAHHLFDETLPRTAEVLDPSSPSTRAVGQPPTTARCMLIRELHLVKGPSMAIGGE